MRRILLVSQEYPPRLGGAGVVAKQNAEKLAALGHEVVVLTRGRPCLDDAESPVRVIRACGSTRLWPFYFAFWIKRLDTYSFDSIILNDIGAAFVFGTFFFKSHCVRRTIVFLHGNEPQAIIQKPVGYLKVTRFCNRYMSLLNRCSVIVSVSHYMKSDFLLSVGGLLPENKIKVIYAGVDHGLFRPVDRTLIRKKVGIDCSVNLIISVARITREKGFDTMLTIFSDVLKEDPNWVWLVVGEGSYVAQMQEVVARECISRQVIFLGRVPREELAHYYSAADLFWLLSERESFGLVYAEAQSCGCPAIGYNRTGVVEAIENHKSGFLVSDAEECKRLLVQHAHSRISRSAALRAASKFSLDKQASILSLILEES